MGGALIFVAWAALYALPLRPEVSFAVGSLAILLLLLGATLLVPAVVGLAERLARPAAVLAFGNEGLLGSGNVRRATGRTALTVAALLVGIAMVIATNSLAGAFTHDLTSWVETALGGDLYVRAPQPMREQFEDRQQTQQYLTTAEGRQLYQRRAGVEGTISQGVRAFGLRLCRYRGLAKTSLQHIATAAAINLDRLIAWFNEIPQAHTRTSRFARLAPA